MRAFKKHNIFDGFQGIPELRGHVQVMVEKPVRRAKAYYKIYRETILQYYKKYIEITHRNVFFEYVLLEGQHDSISHADKLGRLLKPLMCHLNLIPVNPTLTSNYTRSNSEKIRHVDFENISIFSKTRAPIGWVPMRLQNLTP